MKHELGIMVEVAEVDGRKIVKLPGEHWRYYDNQKPVEAKKLMEAGIIEVEAS